LEVRVELAQNALVALVEELRAFDADVRDESVEPRRQVPMTLPIMIISAGTSRHRTMLA
jgi:hypothetical protein